jgi:hypothetical protein
MLQYTPNVNQDGHCWILNPAKNVYELHWEPIPNVYSPPKYYKDVHCYSFEYTDDIPISILIGTNGYHFKNISRLSNAPYIFYQKDTHRIEIWGNVESIQNAYGLLQKHIQYWKNKLSQNRK